LTESSDLTKVAGRDETRPDDLNDRRARVSTDYETILFSESEGIGWLTLNRPQALNAFDDRMQREVRSLYRDLRRNDDVRVLVITGAGDRAFCSGADRHDVSAHYYDDLATRPEPLIGPVSSTPFMVNDAAENLGPKSCGLWKPVIAAVNGLACGGAFYVLGECDFIIASEDATFFDPHLDYGIAPIYEPINLLDVMPLQEVLRLALLGGSERMSAHRAHQVGLVSEVVAADELHERARWAATVIATYRPVAVQAALRAIWHAKATSRRQGLDQAYAFVALGNDREAVDEGQQRFTTGSRPAWRLR